MISTLTRYLVKAALAAVCVLSADYLQAQTVNVVGVRRVTLSEGRNFVSLPLLPPQSTLPSVLGTNQLPAATTESAATVVDVWDQTNQSLTNRFWFSSASGFTGWRRGGSFADASGVALDANKGLIVTIRAGAGSQTLYLLGRVPRQQQAQVVHNNGYTLAASNYPVPMSLTNSGLIASGFVGGNSLITSDSLLFFNPASQIYDVKVWYDTAGGVWRNADASVATKQLTPGEAFLIRRRARAGDFTWPNPVPYNVSGVWP